MYLNVIVYLQVCCMFT